MLYVLSVLCFIVSAATWRVMFKSRSINVAFYSGMAFLLSGMAGGILLAYAVGQY